MKMRWLAAVLLVLLLTGCEEMLTLLGLVEEEKNESDAYEMVRLPYSNPVLNYDGSAKVYELDWEGQNSMSISVHGAFSGEDMILVKANANPVIKTNGSQGVVTTSTRDSSSAEFLSDSAASANPQGIVRLTHEGSASFYLMNPPRPESGLTRSTASEGAYTVNVSTKNFHVESASNTWITEAATLRYSGENTYIWVADANWGTDGSQTNNMVGSTDINNLGDQFDGPNKIYDWVTNLYGYEFGGGPSGNGGKDGDKEVHILIYDIFYDYSASQDSGVLGYFWPKDEYSDTKTQAWNPSLRSNEMEIFYLDTHFLDYAPDIMYSTLAHELQHMIHFNVKFVDHGASSGTWFNEMLSMLAEDVLQDKMGIQDGDSPKSRAQRFNYTYQSAGVLDWDSDDPLPNYASAFVFGAFLTRAFGGAELIEAIMESSYVDRDAINDALGKLGYNLNFDDAFEYYQMALVFNKSNYGSGMKILESNTSRTVGSHTYTQTGFDLYDYLNPGKDGTYYTSDDFYGPSLFDSTANISLRPYGSLLTSKNNWLSLNGSQSLEFSVSAPDDGVHYYLLFK